MSSYFSAYTEERFFMVEFQWFFMALSVLPGKKRAISAQRFPIFLCARNKIHSSRLLHSYFLILGLRWLCHLSRHCFPTLPVSYWKYPEGFMQSESIFVDHVSWLNEWDNYLLPTSMLAFSLNSWLDTFRVTKVVEPWLFFYLVFFGLIAEGSFWHQ